MRSAPWMLILPGLVHLPTFNMYSSLSFFAFFFILNFRSKLQFLFPKSFVVGVHYYLSLYTLVQINILIYDIGVWDVWKLWTSMDRLLSLVIEEGKSTKHFWCILYIDILKVYQFFVCFSPFVLEDSSALGTLVNIRISIMKRK